MAPIPTNSISSRERRPKNAWFFYTRKISDTYEIGIGYKNSKGEGAPNSTCSKSVYRKIPFGPPTRCDYVTRKDNDGEFINEFQFKNNRRESMQVWQFTIMFFTVYAVELISSEWF